jgi:hypothetical protein
LPVGEILEDRNAGSVFFLCVSDQGVHEEIAWLPVGEVFEDRNGDRGEDAQVRTGALPAALCTFIFHLTWMRSSLFVDEIQPFVDEI